MVQRKAFSIREVAAILGISPATVRSEIFRGKLPSFRVGKRVLVPAAALEDLLRCAAPRPEPGNDLDAQ